VAFRWSAVTAPDLLLDLLAKGASGYHFFGKAAERIVTEPPRPDKARRFRRAPYIEGALGMIVLEATSGMNQPRKICAGKQEIGWEHHYGIVRALDSDLFHRGQ
jgi:hypothetical protein